MDPKHFGAGSELDAKKKSCSVSQALVAGERVSKRSGLGAVRGTSLEMKSKGFFGRESLMGGKKKVSKSRSRFSRKASNVVTFGGYFRDPKSNFRKDSGCIGTRGKLLSELASRWGRGAPGGELRPGRPGGSRGRGPLGERRAAGRPGSLPPPPPAPPRAQCACSKGRRGGRGPAVLLSPLGIVVRVR